MATTKQLSKHTPGPWRLCYDGQIDGADGNHVCSFRWSSYKDFNDSPQNKATARLITQAPKMYELLRHILTTDGIPRSIAPGPMSRKDTAWLKTVYDEARRIKAEIDGHRITG